MKRIWGHVVSIVAVGMAIGALTPACAKNDASIFIRSALAPSSNRVNGACVFLPDPTAPSLSLAQLDVGVRDDYFAQLLVGNQLIVRGDPLDPRAETNRVHIDGAVVSVTNRDGSSLPGDAGSFTSPGTGFVDPETANNPSYGILGVSIIDAKTSAALAAQLPNRTTTKTVLVNVRAFGKTNGGVDVESNDFQLVMQVCNGCLVTFPPTSVDPTKPLPNCAAPIDTTTTTTTLPCVPGQDEPTSCQLCQGRPACNP